MATVRLAKEMRRPKKQSAKKKSVVKAVFVMSDAEIHLRRYLTQRKRIKSQVDDKGLYNWLDSMRVPEDARSEWEKDVQARLGRELGLPIK